MKEIVVAKETQFTDLREYSLVSDQGRAVLVVIICDYLFSVLMGSHLAL